MNTRGVVLFVIYVTVEVKGHGFLMQPPQRSSAWRFGFDKAPKNYNDMELFCGGFQRQWEVNGGKCGTCGDPYDGERQNEAGGRYARGIITGSYVKGDVAEIKVRITAYHKGWFEFRLCAHNDVTTAVSQECLDKTLLKVAETGETRVDLEKLNVGVGDYKIGLQLPADITCDQCVLQWKYNTGNSEGVDEDGNRCIGCGAQETFINCADIEIKGSDPPTPVVSSTSTPRPTSGSPTTTTSTAEGTTITVSPAATTSNKVASTTLSAITTAATTARLSSSLASASSTKATTTIRRNSSTTSSSSSPPSTTTTIEATTASTSTSTESVNCGAVCAAKPLSITHCAPVGFWKMYFGMETWCYNNCRMSHCPSSMCLCYC